MNFTAAVFLLKGYALVAADNLCFLLCFRGGTGIPAVYTAISISVSGSPHLAVKAPGLSQP